MEIKVNTPKTLTVKEAAQILGITSQAVTVWIRSGTRLGPKFYSDPNHADGWKYIIKKADLTAYVRALAALKKIGGQPVV